MASTPKCILLTGPLGAGKSTLATRYGADHPLTLVVSTDELIVMVSGWLENENKALHMAFEFALDMTRRHLHGGNDVILPYFVHSADEIRTLENIARECGAEFIPIFLEISEDTSVKRTLARGSWGEPGTPPITEADIPIIQAKFAEVAAACSNWPNLKILDANTDLEKNYHTLAMI